MLARAPHVRAHRWPLPAACQHLTRSCAACWVPRRSGLSSALGGRLGIVSASNSGAIKHLPVAELRRAAQDQGIAVLSELASADWNQVRSLPEAAGAVQVRASRRAAAACLVGILQLAGLARPVPLPAGLLSVGCRCESRPADAPSRLRARPAPPQWPLERLSAFRAHQLVEELAIAQQQYSTEYEDEMHTERDGSEAQVRWRRGAVAGPGRGGGGAAARSAATAGTVWWLGGRGGKGQGLQGWNGGGV